MENNSLKIERRNDVGGGRGRRMRGRGMIPAVIYGGDMQSAAVSVKTSELKQFIKRNGRNAVFQTEFAQEHDLSVLIKDIQFDPVNKEIVHLDFQKVNPEERVQVEVPVRITGIDAVTRAGYVVMHQTDTIKVECLPRDIPHHVDADVTGYMPGSSFTAGDLKFTGKISLISKPGEIIVTVNGREKESEPVEGPAAQIYIFIIQKKSRW